MPAVSNVVDDSEYINQRNSKPGTLYERRRQADNPKLYNFAKVIEILILLARQNIGVHH